MNPEFHFEVLPKPQRKLWDLLKSQAPFFETSKFYLAGGTALALQIGHRRSVDFDFFSQETLLASAFTREWEQMPGVVLREKDPRTIHADIQGVKLSLIAGYKYPRILKGPIVDGISLASLTDIALMKFLAITHRAAIRDYLDLAIIFRDHLPLSTIIRLSRRKYGRTFNPMISIRALASFNDLDQDIPILLDKTLRRSWKDILIKEVKKSLL